MWGKNNFSKNCVGAEPFCQDSLQIFCQNQKEFQQTMFPKVMALRTLVTSIAHTLKALFWALTLLSLIVYVFAILFSQAVHSASLEAETADAASVASEKYFRSLPDTMLTLFMSIAGGVSWEHVIYPLKDIHITWALFFLFYVPWVPKMLKHKKKRNTLFYVFEQRVNFCVTRDLAFEWRRKRLLNTLGSPVGTPKHFL